jgi:hypothetical protein
MRRVVWSIALAALSGCVHAAYNFVPTTQHKAAARAPGCDFEILTARPDRRFVELGVLEWKNIATDSVEEFRGLVQSSVCATGGDAVLSEVNGAGRYVRGTVIKYTDASAAPEAGTLAAPPAAAGAPAAAPPAALAPGASVPQQRDDE